MNHDMCKGRGWVCLEVKGGKFDRGYSQVWPYTVDVNDLWLQPFCRGCRQKPTNVSGSKTHKSQEPGLMAHQHRQKARGHLDGCGLVLCKLTFWGLFTQLVQCKFIL